MAGMLLVLVGFGMTAEALIEWRRAAFGMLDFEHIARIVIPAGLMITLGIETILFSFFLSTLGMNTRHHPAESPAEYRPEGVAVS